MQQHAGNMFVAHGQSFLSPSGLSGWWAARSTARSTAAALAAVPGRRDPRSARYCLQKNAAFVTRGPTLMHPKLVFTLLAVSTGQGVLDLMHGKIMPLRADLNPNPKKSKSRGKYFRCN